jgi:hypothetical protein
VAILVVLMPSSDAEPSLQQAAVAELAHLGITKVALLRDDRTFGLVLEGWAFDAGRSAEAVVAAVAGGASRVRTLHPLLEMAVSAAPHPPGGGET